MMIKIDQNLRNLREKITPDLVSEEDFWRNYFFEVEKIMHENNQPHRLGNKIDPAEKERIQHEALLHSQPNQMLANESVETYQDQS
jgi:BSD domain